MKRLNVLTSSIILGGISLFSYVQAAEFAALAIDRNNGFAYGWSHGQASLVLAEQRATEECKKRTDHSCTVVLSWSGDGCGVYRTVEGNVGTAYGWGVAPTQGEADKIATQNVLKRSNGKIAPNHVWACNATDKNKLKVIKNADSGVKTVKIGSQVWMAENLNATHFRNGDVIPFARNTAEAQVGYKNNQYMSRIWKDNPANEKKYGRYYSWQMALDKRGICPVGFHLPSKTEWEILFQTVGNDPAVIATKLKSKNEWNKKSGKGTDDYGFNVLPANRVIRSDSFKYEFNDTYQYNDAYFWTSTKYDSDNIWAVEFFMGEKVELTKIGYDARAAGLNIRCIQD
jgi:uncharacterized protein (TIGR02145 family)